MHPKASKMPKPDYDVDVDYANDAIGEEMNDFDLECTIHSSNWASSYPVLAERGQCLSGIEALSNPSFNGSSSQNSTDGVIEVEAFTCISRCHIIRNTANIISFGGMWIFFFQIQIEAKFAAGNCKFHHFVPGLIFITLQILNTKQLTESSLTKHAPKNKKMATRYNSFIEDAQKKVNRTYVLLHLLPQWLDITNHSIDANLTCGWWMHCQQLSHGITSLLGQDDSKEEIFWLPEECGNMIKWHDVQI